MLHTMQAIFTLLWEVSASGVSLRVWGWPASRVLPQRPLQRPALAALEGGSPGADVRARRGIGACGQGQQDAKCIPKRREPKGRLDTADDGAHPRTPPSASPLIAQELTLTVGHRTDTLILSYDLRMGTPERRVRRQLHDLGGRCVPCKPGTKKRAWFGTHTSPLLLGGDCLITVPPGHVLIDPDSLRGQQLVEMLDLPRTLALGARRGVRLVFQLPEGVRLRQQIGFLTDLDIIVDWFVAPGSVVDGQYYGVVDEHPIAEMPFHIAEGIRMLQQRDVSGMPMLRRATGLRFICEDVLGPMKQKAAENRRAQARAARGRSTSVAKRRLASGADRRTDEELLAVDVDGERHQAMATLVVRRRKEGVGCEALESEISRHPLGSKLAGKSPAWFRRCVWDPTVDWMASQTLTPRRASAFDAGNRLMRRWRHQDASPAVRRWLQHVDSVLALREPDEDLRRSYQLVCQLHAKYALGFGGFGAQEGIKAVEPCHYLAYSLVREELGQVGGDVITRRHQRLGEWGLLRQLERTKLVKGQATYYQLLINGRQVLPPPPPCSSCLSWPLTCGVARARGHCGVARTAWRKCEPPALSFTASGRDDAVQLRRQSGSRTAQPP
jgi:hypothetical protein